MYNGEVVRVEQITKKKIGYHRHKGEARMNYARLFELESIPITEELLLNNRFVLPEHKEFYTLLNINGKDEAIRLTKNFTSYNVEIFTEHPDYVMLEHSIKGIRYVHDLQNAYNLVTKEELILNL